MVIIYTIYEPRLLTALHRLLRTDSLRPTSVFGWSTSASLLQHIFELGVCIAALQP